jgi:hypothetical protein
MSKSNAAPQNIAAVVSSTSSRRRSTSHPRYNLQRAEEFARTIFDEGPRHCDQDNIAKKAGYKSANNGAFMTLRATASQFGFITYHDRYLSVTEPWIEAFNSEDSGRLKQALQEAMYQPELYQLLLEDYSERQLPSQERLTRELFVNTKYGILKDSASVAAQCFIESATYASMIDTKGFVQAGGRVESSTKEKPMSFSAAAEVMSDRSEQSPRVTDGEYLDAPKAGLVTVVIPAGLNRIDVPLQNGKKAVLFVPETLLHYDKERLKKYIDLQLDERDEADLPSAGGVQDS